MANPSYFGQFVWVSSDIDEKPIILSSHAPRWNTIIYSDPITVMIGIFSCFFNGISDSLRMTFSDCSTQCISTARRFLLYTCEIPEKHGCRHTHWRECHWLMICEKYGNFSRSHKWNLPKNLAQIQSLGMVQNSHANKQRINKNNKNALVYIFESTLNRDI